MNRKNKTVKQLQAECRKRKIGFMMNWTKIALTKRLEDEDKRDASRLKLEESTAKNIKDKQDKLNEQQIQMEQYTKALGKLDKSEIERKIKSDMIVMQERKLISMREELDRMKREQNILIEKSNEIARESIELAKEIKSLEFSVATLK
jgi:hypothetical protein